MENTKLSSNELKEIEENLELELEEIPAQEEEIEVVKEEEQNPVKEEEKTSDKEEISPDDGIKQLRFELEQQKLRAMEAEKQARELQQRAYKAETEKNDAELHLLKGSIETTKRRAEFLQSQLRDAIAIGDHDLQAKLHVAIARNEQDLNTLENGFSEYERRPKPSIDEFKPRPSDPVEAFASQLSPASADWVRAHPEYVTNPSLYKKMEAAHNLVTADGIKVDSPAYFREIENILKIRPSQAIQRDDDEYMQEPAPKPTLRRKEAPPAAPVSRSGSGTGSRPTVVRLSAAEREMAQLSGLTEKEYALQKEALRREGLLK